MWPTIEDTCLECDDQLYMSVMPCTCSATNHPPCSSCTSGEIFCPGCGHDPMPVAKILRGRKLTFRMIEDVRFYDAGHGNVGEEPVFFCELFLDDKSFMYAEITHHPSTGDEKFQFAFNTVSQNPIDDKTFKEFYHHAEPLK